MDITISAQHDEAVRALYTMREKLAGLSRSERLIVEMAIMMLEYLPEYVADASVDDGPAWSTDQLMAAAQNSTKPRRNSRLQWTIEDFDQLICSGGFELADGILVPRF
jgi:hypothetical protein